MRLEDEGFLKVPSSTGSQRHRHLRSGLSARAAQSVQTARSLAARPLAGVELPASPPIGDLHASPWR